MARPAHEVGMGEAREMQLRDRHVGEEGLARLHAALHEVNRALGHLAVDQAARVMVENFDVARFRSLLALHDVRDVDDLRIVAVAGQEHRFVHRPRDAVPLVEAAVGRQASLAVAEMPFAVERGGVALLGDLLRHRDFPARQPLRQPGRDRLEWRSSWPIE